MEMGPYLFVSHSGLWTWSRRHHHHHHHQHRVGMIPQCDSPAIRVTQIRDQWLKANWWARMTVRCQGYKMLVDPALRWRASETVLVKVEMPHALLSSRHTRSEQEIISRCSIWAPLGRISRTASLASMLNHVCHIDPVINASSTWMPEKTKEQGVKGSVDAHYLLWPRVCKRFPNGGSGLVRR